MDQYNIKDTERHQIVHIPEPHSEYPNHSSLDSQTMLASVHQRPRLISLDAFRGLTIALMLLVNNMALDTATPRQFVHARWDEMIHLADLVFPWFLFCAGVAIPFAAASFKRKGLPSWRYDIKVIMRTLILILLGCLIESSFSHRIHFSLGILQIIGLAYFLGAFLYDLPVFRRILIAAGTLTLYWFALKYVPTPGLGVGVIQENQNLVQYLNQNFFGTVRILDHELNLWGLPSVVPTTALVMIGSLIGDLLRAYGISPLRKVAGLITAGLTLAAGGFLWNHSLAFNKSLWTPSYILLSAGTATIILGIFYFLIDSHQWKHYWAYPFVVFGSNAILAYVAPILTKVFVLDDWQALHNVTIRQWYLQTLSTTTNPITGGWLYTLSFIALWWGILWILYRKKIFVRV